MKTPEYWKKERDFSNVKGSVIQIQKSKGLEGRKWEICCESRIGKGFYCREKK